MSIQTKVHFAETAETLVFVDTFYYHQVEDWFEVLCFFVFLTVMEEVFTKRNHLTFLEIDLFSFLLRNRYDRHYHYEVSWQPGDTAGRECTCPRNSLMKSP